MIEIHRLPFWPALRLPYRLTRVSLEFAVDKVLGVQTTLLRNEVHLGLDQPAGFTFGPVGWTTLWRVFRRLAPTPDDVLYDVGSGSGRVLIAGGRYPFGKIVGVELSPPMYEQAKANLAKCRFEPVAPVELVNADAIEQPIPERTSVIYFYNSFRGQSFSRFIAHLLDDIDRDPRPLRFVYTNPVEHEKLQESGRFRLVHRFRGWRPTENWSRMLSTYFYEVLPADTAARPTASNAA